MANENSQSERWTLLEKIGTTRSILHLACKLSNKDADWVCYCSTRSIITWTEAVSGLVARRKTMSNNLRICNGKLFRAKLSNMSTNTFFNLYIQKPYISNINTTGVVYIYHCFFPSDWFWFWVPSVAQGVSLKFRNRTPEGNDAFFSASQVRPTYTGSSTLKKNLFEKKALEVWGLVIPCSSITIG